MRTQRSLRPLAALLLVTGGGALEIVPAAAIGQARPIGLARAGMPPHDSTMRSPDVASRVRTGTISGIVHSDAGGTILPGARVECGAERMATQTDTSGAYLLRGVPSGANDIRVTLDGYDPLTLGVSVPADGTVRVDVMLTRHLVYQRAALVPVHVVAPTRVALPPSQAVAAAGAVDPWGTWHWNGDVIRSVASSGEPDVFRILSDNPTVAMRPESPSSIMAQGGGVTKCSCYSMASRFGVPCTLAAR